MLRTQRIVAIGVVALGLLTVCAAAADPGYYTKKATWQETLQAALLHLPAAQRVPLVLHHFEEMSYDQIARQLGVSLGKVKTDIHRGREALRKILQFSPEGELAAAPPRPAIPPRPSFMQCL